MALIPPFFLDCVVAIGFESKPGDIRYVATGFLIGLNMTEASVRPKTYRVYLVTNRHVVLGKKIAHVRFNPAGGHAAKAYDAELVDSSGKALWMSHSDPAVDVAVLPINAALLREHDIAFNWFRSDQHVLKMREARDAGLSEGDGVFVLGFPLGQTGGERNYVIVRAGAVARVRDVLAGAARDFLVDAAIFPGNSGGPVITRPEFTSITGTKAISNASLLRIVTGYVPYEDVAISAQTNLPRVVFQENSGLAKVVPIDRVFEVIGQVETIQASDLPPVAKTPDAT